MADNVNVVVSSVEGLLRDLTDIMNQLEETAARGHTAIQGAEGYWNTDTRATLETHFSNWQTSTKALLDQIRNETVPAAQQWLRNFEEVSHRGLTAS